MQPPAHLEDSAVTADAQRAIYAEQVKQLYGSAFVGLLASVINSLVLAVIQRHVTSHTTLIAWVALLSVLSLLRYRDIRAFWRRSPTASEVGRWSRRFVVGLALSGMVWGSSAILLFPSESLAHQTFLAFVIGGMVAGAAAAFSSVMSAFLAYSVPALSPIIVRFALIGDEIHLAMAGMTLLFGVMMFFLARRINAVRITSVKLRFEKSDLELRVEEGSERLRKAYENLQQEMREREHAESQLKAMERIKRAEEALRASEVRYRRLFETAQDGILIADADTGEIDDVNPCLTDMLGYSREELLGRKVWEVGLFEDSTAGTMALRELRDKGLLRHKDSPLVTKFGQEITIECVGNVSDAAGKKIIQCNIRDVTERKRLEEKLENMSLVDDLTGLYNRRGFLALAQQQLIMAERTRQQILLFYVDLDGLKQINDAWGHQEGDIALVEVAAVLKETFRKSDIIGRVGGDEFAILALDTAHEPGDVLVDRFRTAVQDRSRSETRKYELSMTAGIAPYDPDNPSSLDDLLGRADALMYEQKRRKHR